MLAFGEHGADHGGSAERKIERIAVRAWSTCVPTAPRLGTCGCYTKRGFLSGTCGTRRCALAEGNRTLRVHSIASRSLHGVSGTLRSCPVPPHFGTKSERARFRRAQDRADRRSRLVHLCPNCAKRPRHCRPASAHGARITAQCALSRDPGVLGPTPGARGSARFARDRLWILDARLARLGQRMARGAWSSAV
jgi:hypothetical protein